MTKPVTPRLQRLLDSRRTLAEAEAAPRQFRGRTDVERGTAFLHQQETTTMQTIDRKRLQRFLDQAGDTLRALAAHRERDGATPDAVQFTKDLADKADELLELVEAGAEIEGDL